jgi:hypothetical protein
LYRRQGGNARAKPERFFQLPEKVRKSAPMHIFARFFREADQTASGELVNFVQSAKDISG